MVEFEVEREVESRFVNDRELFRVNISLVYEEQFEDEDEAYAQADMLEGYMNEIKNYVVEIGDGEEEVQCSGETSDGDRCTRMTKHPSGLCWQHR